MPTNIPVVERILSANDRLAQENRAILENAGVFAINIMASPGAGKTSLIEQTVRALKGKLRIGMINGDIATSLDADRAAAAGAAAVQVNTGGECHLDAVMLHDALPRMALDSIDLLIVENVGNLICPAGFDLGEAHKVVVLSVTEGEDKPVKYPNMFAAADLMLLNKSDLLPHLDFDIGLCVAHALRVNPHLQTLVVSARTGEGMAALYAWIESRAARLAEQRSRAAASAAQVATPSGAAE
jgi:hydrogenase nickel incorporation protein HypB